MALIREIQEGEIGKRCRGELHRKGVWLTYDSFYKNAARADGYQSTCKECHKITNSKCRDNMERYHERSGRRFQGTPGAEERIRRFIDADNAQERLKEFTGD